MRRDPARRPTHPGALLREDVLPALGKSRSEAARLLGVPRRRLDGLLSEREPVSPEMALRLGEAFGGSGLWVRMQAAHDLWRRRDGASPAP